MSKRPEKTINKNTAKTAKRLLKYVTDTYNCLLYTSDAADE